MTFSNRMMLALAIALAVSWLPSGCRRPVQPVQESSPSISTDSTPTPGIVRLEGDQVLAVGTLVYERKRKLFALVDAGPDTNLTGKERIIASIDSGAQADNDLIGLIGAYVELSGDAIESTSAFPELSIVSIRILSLPSERANEASAAK